MKGKALLRDLLSWLSLQAKDPKRSSLLLAALGLLGILLLFASSPAKKEAKAEDALSRYLPDSEALEEELQEFLSCIDGAGETKVLLSFYDDGESVYLKEESISASGSGEKYVIVENSDGRTAVEISCRLPEVKGVAVLCEGADDPEVSFAVTEAVCTALGISSHRVSVSKIAP